MPYNKNMSATGYYKEPGPKLDEDSPFKSMMERFRFAPWGVQGGRPGELFKVTVTRADGSVEQIGKIDVLVLNKGDVVTMLSPGGGGYGPRAERDPALAARDKAFGYVTED